MPFGRDYDHVTGTVTTGATQYGITVPDLTQGCPMPPCSDLRPVVDGALTSTQKDNVMGTGGTATTASIGNSMALPYTSVTALANTLCGAAPIANQTNTPATQPLAISGTN
jgi:hypothetical protein